MMPSLIRRLFQKSSPTPDGRESIPSFTVEEQFALLSSELRGSPSPGSLGKLAERHFDGYIGKLGRLFTITREDYLDWARQRPISAFVAVEPGQSDGYYLARAKGALYLQYQERGGICYEQRFASEEQAHAYVIRHCSPYGIYEQLARKAGS